MTLMYSLGVNAPLVPIAAHHSPEEVIAHLSSRLETHGNNTTLLLRRADEWRVLGEPSKAANDYEHALKLEAMNPLAYLGLARTRISQKRYRDAIKMAKRGVALVDTPDAQAAFHAIVASAHAEMNNHPSALVAWKAAIDCERPEVDWFLGQARTLNNLGLHPAARDALLAARNRNPSVVLQRAWIDSLILCGDFQIAERQIDAGLQRSHWKSSWLLQRAKLRVARNELILARQDAAAALKEIAIRTTPDVENPLLEQQQHVAQSLVLKLSQAGPISNSSGN
ncbi:hypothetical protein HG15A2_01860 [Adhaeretor mobilis]|uniref:Uncharacterized protein n=2 Tax=Adhaeretor mobilis TaxID=1930276 RepID=A0A517MQ67_9BACT|nr:hypothetical protein HG15A2_01860 [Adhaeretor mobilis]